MHKVSVPSLGGCSRRSRGWSQGDRRGRVSCGSAGIYKILNPEPARELGDRKAADVLDTGAQVLVTANPGA